MKRRRKARQAAPHEVALRLAALLPEPNALIGALAVAAHGLARATDDVDFVCLEDPKEIQARLSNAGIESAVRRGVYGTLDGIRFDVLFPPVPIDWEKTVLLPLAKDSRLRVVDLDGLIRLKLRAGGPQDLIDVVQLVRRHREAEPTALRVAEAYQLRDRLESWLAGPRIRSPEPAAPGTRTAQTPRPGKARRSRGKIRARV